MALKRAIVRSMMAKKMIKPTIEEVIARLSDEEKDIVRKKALDRYGDRNLKLDEVSRILGYSIKTTRRLATQDVFPTFRMNGNVRSDPVLLFQWLEGLKKEPVIEEG